MEENLLLKIMNKINHCHLQFRINKKNQMLKLVQMLSQQIVVKKEKMKKKNAL